MNCTMKKKGTSLTTEAVSGFVFDCLSNFTNVGQEITPCY